ncbi:aromatic-ring hydroxylase C-terminal domain-containing protein [Mycobacteroides abscessus]|uniref:aromatic-ring hydroxylase C-terminal domain-containing protein n=1 Tax=Mycobacteroides abscessus TaxID=36809 RepID=UPI00373FE2B3
MPGDAECQTSTYSAPPGPSQARRIYEFLNAARPVLLAFSAVEFLAEAANVWAGRIDVVAAEIPADPWDVAGAGALAAPSALLIRPDGNVAWVSEEGTGFSGLRDCLMAWRVPGRPWQLALRDL